jgi:CBS domain containing-hemolysin-like protein
MSDSSNAPPNGGSDNGGPSWVTRFLQRLNLQRKRSIRDNLEEVLAEAPNAEAQPEFTQAEQTMLQNVLALRERRVSDVMIPRSEIVAVPLSITLGELLQNFASAGHSRLVVYGETLDDPTGMVHIRDLVSYLTSRATAATATTPKPARRKWHALDPRAIDLTLTLSDSKLTRRILYVPPSMAAVDLLVRMQATRIHLALVIDEYGGTDGLASIEDIVEEIVGDIEDEHDEEEAKIVALGDGSFLADARASLHEAAQMLGSGFETGASGDEVDTVGGLLVTLAAKVPPRGEIVRGPGEYDFEVIDADPRRVKRVRIFRRPPDPPKRERKRKSKAAEPPAESSEAAPPESMDKRSASG